MKRKLASLLLIVPLLASCSGNQATLEQFREKAEELSNAPLYPYYRVQAMMDFNNEVVSVDSVFDKDPVVDYFVPYSRYNDGFFVSTLDTAEDMRNISIYAMSSKSYWLRAPLRITQDNFYTTVASDKGRGEVNGTHVEVNFKSGVIDGLGEEYSMPTLTKVDNNTLVLTYGQKEGEEEVEKVVSLTRTTEYDETIFYNGTWEGEGFKVTLNQDKRENRTCAHYLIEHIITSYMDLEGSANPSKNNMTYEYAEDGGFVFVGNAVHTKVTVDNYPYYPDPSAHPELDEWSDEDPLPCYKNIINAKVDIRFEYNKDGWLVKESMTSKGYNYHETGDAQISLIATYNYKFSD